MKKLLLALPIVTLLAGCNVDFKINQGTEQKEEISDFEKDAYVYSLSDLGYITKMNTKTKEVAYVNQVGFTSLYNDSWSSIRFVSENEAYTIGEKTGVLIKFNPTTGTHTEVATAPAEWRSHNQLAFYKTLEIGKHNIAYTILNNEVNGIKFGTLVSISLETKVFAKVNETKVMENVGGNLKYVAQRLSYSIDSKGRLFKINNLTGEFKIMNPELSEIYPEVVGNEEWTGIGYISETEIYAISKETGTLAVFDATGENEVKIIGNANADSVHDGRWMSLSVISSNLAYTISHDGHLVKINPTTGEFKKVLNVTDVNKVEDSAGQLIEDSWCSITFSNFI